ncbi:hypothetical protein P3T24_007882 [Paraburkholderia sp. GAS33]
MLLGMDFLRWRKVWLSYSTNQVFIQDTPRRPPLQPNALPTAAIPPAIAAPASIPVSNPAP